MYNNHHIRVCGGVDTLPKFNELKPNELSLDKLEYKILTWTEIPKPVSGGKRKTRRSKHVAVKHVAVKHVTVRAVSNHKFKRNTIV